MKKVWNQCKTQTICCVKDEFRLYENEHLRSGPQGVKVSLGNDIQNNHKNFLWLKNKVIIISRYRDTSIIWRIRFKLLFWVNIKRMFLLRYDYPPDHGSYQRDFYRTQETSNLLWKEMIEIIPTKCLKWNFQALFSNFTSLISKNSLIYYLF